MTTRTDIVAKAREFLGTPHHHAARVPGVGMDCIGLPICVMRSLGLVSDDFDVPNYVQAPDGSALLMWCKAHLPLVSQLDTRIGDMMVFATDVHPQHVGIIGNHQHGGFSIIHAANNAAPPRVIETRLVLGKRLRYVAAFSLVGGVA